MSNLSYDNDLLCNWDFLGNDNWRLYFKVDDHNSTCNSQCGGLHGFKFAVIEWVSNLCDEVIWGENTEVEFLFNGIAMFDGIRHMWLNTTQDEIFGYINYPKIDELIVILSEIRKLELKFCYDP